MKTSIMGDHLLTGSAYGERYKVPYSAVREDDPMPDRDDSEESRKDGRCHQGWCVG